MDENTLVSQENFSVKYNPRELIKQIILTSKITTMLWIIFEPFKKLKLISTLKQKSLSSQDTIVQLSRSMIKKNNDSPIFMNSGFKSIIIL